MKRLVLLVAASALLLSSTADRALAVPAFTLDNTTSSFVLGNPPFTLGWQFQVVNDITVTALGIFDSGQNGLVDSYPSGIWDSTGKLLASTTIDSGTTDPLINQFRYQSITPITLLAGQTYNIGALFLTPDDPLIFPGNAINFVTDPDIRFISSQFAFGSTLSDPTSSSGTAPGYFSSNFILTPVAPVPEPSSLTLLGLSIPGLLAYGWRRRKLAAA